MTKPLNGKTQVRTNPLDRTVLELNRTRAGRPENIDGQVECPFCPQNGHLRTDTLWSYYNARGWDVIVVPNMFNSRGIETVHEVAEHGPYRVETGYGAHNVVIETPCHDLQPWDDDFGQQQWFKVLLASSSVNCLGKGLR